VPTHILGDELVKRRVCPRYAERLRALVAQLRPDVIHAHLFATAAAAARATAASRTVLVITEQTEAPWRGPAEREESRRSYARAAHVIGVSTAICRMLTDDFGVPAQNVSFVPNCVLPPPPDAAGPMPDGRPLFGTVARLVPEKGLDTLLRAAARVRERVPGATFALAGDGPLRTELQQLAAQLGLEGSMHFLGHRPDAAALIGRLDALVVPSRSEGTPLAITEALVAGTPVVATPVGGIPDQITDGREGLLVRVDDDAALGEALCRMATDPGLAARLREGARRRAEAFDHDRMVDRLEAILAGAVGGGGLRAHAEPDPARSVGTCTGLPHGTDSRIVARLNSSQAAGTNR
jgi:glycosyltransferase involved in cell wall biosynthesis